MSARVARRDRIALHLTRHRGEWVDGLALAEIGGAYAWRTRVSECRTQLGMVVENRLRKVGDRTVSEYRYPTQAPEPTQAPLALEGEVDHTEGNRETGSLVSRVQ